MARTALPTLRVLLNDKTTNLRALEAAGLAGRGAIAGPMGGITTVLASALAGVVALTVRDPFRWSGLFLLGAAAGPAADSALVWAVVWLAFVVYLGQFNQNAPASLS